MLTEVLDFGVVFMSALAGGDHHRLQRCDIVGKLCRVERHVSKHNCFAVFLLLRKRNSYPAIAGVHVFCGARQSIPSSR